MLAFARPALDWVALDMEGAQSPTGKRLHPFDEQLQRVFPEIYENRNEYLTCGQCVHRTLKRRGLDEATFCGLRLLFIKDEDRWCEVFELRYE